MSQPQGTEEAVQEANELAAFVVEDASRHAELEPAVRTAVAAIVRRLKTAPAHHVVEFTETGWCLMHPLVCDPGLFDCPYNRAAEREFDRMPPVIPGRYALRMTDRQDLIIGERMDGAS